MKARLVALNTLIKIKQEGAYSNNALKEALNEEISLQDKGLITELVYGTLTHLTWLVYQIQPFYQGRVKSWVELLLAMSLYQHQYLEKIPDYALIDEAVEIAKTKGGHFNARVVNAILRKVINEKPRDIDEQLDESEMLSIKYSHPEWLIKLWSSQYGIEKTRGILESNNQKVKMVVRTNLTLTTRADLIKALKVEGIEAKEGILSPSAIIIASGNPLTTNAFKKGHFYIQDEASMLSALALSPEKDAKVLDVCAAPGGKTFQLAEMVGDSGVVYAHDLHEHKIARIKENAKRLKMLNVNPSQLDALELETVYEEERFDYILVDAPCSALGTIRRHPEAKMTKKPSDLDTIITIQQDILNNVAKFLKPNGRMVYSTCTVNKKENEKQVVQFLRNNPNFKLDEEFSSRLPIQLRNQIENGMLQIFPQDFSTDGFFIASLVKKK